MENLYCIVGFTKNGFDSLTEEILYWSNTDGWVRSGYSIFTERERKSYNLPIGGKWQDYYTEQIL